MATPRPPLAYNVAQVPSGGEINGTLARCVWHGVETAVTAQEIQCLGARSAAVPSLVEEEMALLAQVIGLSHERQAWVLSIQRQLAALHAMDLRNAAAAAALRLFYQMAETDYQLAFGEQIAAEVRRQIQNARELKGAGARAAVDEEQLKRQETEDIQHQHDRTATRQRLDRNMTLQLAADPAAPLRLWPQADLRVTVTPLSRDALVARALSMRPDLAAIRLVLKTLDRDTLPLARALLKQRDGALGAPVAQFLRVQHQKVDVELQVRHSQLCHLLANQEQSVATAVLNAADAVEAQYRAIAAARDSHASWLRHLHELQARAESVEVTAFRITEARIGALRAEVALVQSVVALRQAEVNLQEAQGILATECACPPGPTEPALPVVERAPAPGLLELPPAEPEKKDRPEPEKLGPPDTLPTGLRNPVDPGWFQDLGL